MNKKYSPIDELLEKFETEEKREEEAKKIDRVIKVNDITITIKDYLALIFITNVIIILILLFKG